MAYSERAEIEKLGLKPGFACYKSINNIHVWVAKHFLQIQNL